MPHVMILSAVAILIFFTGCSSKSSFPTKGSQALKSESEFGVLTAKPDVFQGRAIKLAGRMVGVETTAEGTIVTAEWMPYPDTEYEGPEGMGMESSKRFVLFYPGKLDPEGRLHGNKFLVVGKKEGASQSLPLIKARCLHVWKTGDNEIEMQPDVENTGYPVMEETYCSKI